MTARPQRLSSKDEPPRRKIAEEVAEQPIVVRDRRRIDPATGKLRPPSDFASPGGEHSVDLSASTPTADVSSDELESLRTQLAERTADLQRITAEYANHRKRVERDRDATVEQATALVLTSLFPVLDDVERARAHGDLTGGFATVAEHLLAAVEKLGLSSFGAEGDVFDPAIHEAVSHAGGDGDTAVCAQVLRKGYALNDKMLRPALVVVQDASGDASAPETADLPGDTS